MKLRYTLPARQDIVDIFDYISKRSPSGALHVLERIKSMAELIQQYPQSGTITEDPAIRRMTTPPYPYRIFYEVTEDEIIIHTVRHTARKDLS